VARWSAAAGTTIRAIADHTDGDDLPWLVRGGFSGAMTMVDLRLLTKHGPRRGGLGGRAPGEPHGS
jgi:hypothetical protein